MGNAGGKLSNIMDEVKLFVKHCVFISIFLLYLYAIYNIQASYLKEKDPLSPDFDIEKFDFNDYSGCLFNCIDIPKNQNEIFYVNELVFKNGMNINNVLNIINNTTLKKQVIATYFPFEKDGFIYLELTLITGLITTDSIVLFYIFDENFELIEKVPPIGK